MVTQAEVQRWERLKEETAQYVAHLETEFNEFEEHRELDIAYNLQAIISKYAPTGLEEPDTLSDIQTLERALSILDYYSRTEWGKPEIHELRMEAIRANGALRTVLVHLRHAKRYLAVNVDTWERLVRDLMQAITVHQATGTSIMQYLNIWKERASRLMKG